MRILILIFAANLTTIFPIAAQDPKVALPTVAAEVPLYPPLARTAHVAGIVHVSVTTDGHAVTETHVEDGNPLLAKSAEENVRTWRFATHMPVTFTVTFHYRLSTKFGHDPDNPTVILRFPTDVGVLRYPMPSGL